MHIVFLHYHLNRGGVTRVIENHLSALAESGRGIDKILLLHGGRDAGWDESKTKGLPFDVEIAVTADLDYDLDAARNPQRLASQIESALAGHEIPRDDAVIHCHNYGLGKNAALLPVIHQMARAGWRLLLHIHDFAEDLRPHNYVRMGEAVGSIEQLQAMLYPVADHVHYAVLNQRDWSRLVRGGIPDGRVHLLPNAVSPLKQSLDCAGARRLLNDRLEIPADRPYLLYPVRPIRRKNLGEFLLWSTLVPEGTFAVTLSPMNAVEKPRFDLWRDLATELDLPVKFGVGEQGGLSLAENYAAADTVMTTSVAEGFGLVFLEAASIAKPLVGRDLPGVTDDFRSHGMTFPGLASSFALPHDIVPVEQLRSEYRKLMRQLLNSYEVKGTEADQLVERIDHMFLDSPIDFGRLTVKMQEEVIRLARRSSEIRDALRRLNPHADQLREASPLDATTAKTNIKVIESHYSVPVIGVQLDGIYQQILNATPTPLVADRSVGRCILESFVDPEQIFPIRLEP